MNTQTLMSQSFKYSCKKFFATKVITLTALKHNNLYLLKYTNKAVNPKNLAQKTIMQRLANILYKKAFYIKNSFLMDFLLIFNTFIVELRFFDQ